jgi:hypothetical protein
MPKDYHFAIGNRADARVRLMRPKVAFPVLMPSGASA